MPTPNRSAAALAARMARLHARDLADAIEPLGIAPAQLMVLRDLWRADGVRDVSQRDLATRLEVEQATMAKTLARMERDGLVTRIGHPQDARVRLIRLTDRARDLRKSAKAAARAVNTSTLGDLTEKERDRLIDLLQRVVDGFGARRRPCPGQSGFDPLRGNAIAEDAAPLAD